MNLLSVRKLDGIYCDECAKWEEKGGIRIGDADHSDIYRVLYLCAGCASRFSNEILSKIATCTKNED